VRAGAAALATAVLTLGMACTVDEVVGSSVVFDGGTPICPGTAPGCTDPVCGSQVCHVGCTGLTDCLTSCSGTSCSFTCERQGLTCTPSCDPGPCTLTCTPNGEQLDCTVSCNPLQSRAADCHQGTCTVACGQLQPATACDAGVYSCSGSCPF
jgi:hypothetical protein